LHSYTEQFGFGAVLVFKPGYTMGNFGFGCAFPGRRRRAFGMWHDPVCASFVLNRRSEMNELDSGWFGARRAVDRPAHVGPATNASIDVGSMPARGAYVATSGGLVAAATE
jgi:hypothetical protein